MRSSPSNSQIAVIDGAARPQGHEAEDLIRRAPMGYLWNQLGSLWLFVSYFLISIISAKNLGADNYGQLAIALTVYNTAVYVAAFGLEDATAVFVPRTLSEHGKGATSALIRRTLATRVVGITVICIAIVLVLPRLVTFFNENNLPGRNFLNDLVPVPEFAFAIAFYVAGTGLMNQLSSIFTALLRTRLTFIVGGLAQIANLILIYVSVHLLGYGVSGVLWGLGAVMWVTAIIYAICLIPFLVRSGPREEVASFNPVLRMGAAAWITNLISGALLKQSAVSMLNAFTVGVAMIGYFSLAFQLSHAAAFLLIAGLGGVGLAAMSAAYVGNNLKALGVAWRAVSKVQILLAVPLLVFVIFNTHAITLALYGADFIAVGPLMQLFLVFNILQRLAGGGAHQAALYVLGKQRIALITQWIGLTLTIGIGVALIPGDGLIHGPGGALIAVGVGQVFVEAFQLILAWYYLKVRYPIRFMARICLALVLPIVLAILVDPSQWALPEHIGPVSKLITALVISGVIFLVVLLLGLLIAKPIEHEDVDLLAQTNPRLRGILSPFASGAPSRKMKLSAITTRRLTSVEDISKIETNRYPRLHSSHTPGSEAPFHSGSFEE